MTVVAEGWWCPTSCVTCRRVESHAEQIPKYHDGCAERAARRAAEAAKDPEDLLALLARESAPGGSLSAHP